MRLTLPYPPSANVYWRFNRNRIHRSDEANRYIANVGMLCNIAQLVPHKEHVCVTLDFYRPARRGDLDNLLKVTLDSLRGHAYLDDSQIVELHASRHEDKHEPRVEVLIQAMGG